MSFPGILWEESDAPRNCQTKVTVAHVDAIGGRESQPLSQPPRERERETNGPLNVRQSWGGERDFFFLISHGRMVSICRREGGREGSGLRMTPLSLIISHMSLLSRAYFTWIFRSLCPVPHWPLINLTIIA